MTQGQLANATELADEMLRSESEPPRSPAPILTVESDDATNRFRAALRDLRRDPSRAARIDLLAAAVDDGLPVAAGTPDTKRIDKATTAVDAALAGRPKGRAAAMEILGEDGRDEAASIAQRAIGLSWRAEGNLARAASALRRAIAIAEAADAPRRAAEARMSLVTIYADQGRTGAALKEAARADAVLTGLDRARLGVNVALVLVGIGRVDEALDVLGRSQPVLMAAGDDRWEALLVNMRGIICARQGRQAEAAADLRRGEELALRGGHHVVNGMIQLNLAWVARLTGDVPGALARLERAGDLYAENGRVGSSLATDKADVLVAAGRVGDARATINRAIDDQKRTGSRYDQAEFFLYAARLALVDEDPAAAVDAARTAWSMFARQRRAAWVDLARHVELSARFARGERSAQLMGSFAGLGDRMAAVSPRVSALEAWLSAGRVAADLGQNEQARRLFEQVAAYRNHGPAESRVLAWYAHALRALTTGRSSAAERALRAGLRVQAEHHAILGADVQTSTVGHGPDLAAVGLGLALERGAARTVLRWAETGRAASLRRRPVRPPDDARLAADLTELRRVVAEMTAIPSAQGAASRSDTERLNSERLRLEAAIRTRLRGARGTYAPEPPFSVAALVDALGERVLVEFVRLDDDLHAVTVRDGVVRRQRLGSYTAVLKQLDVVRFAMNRMSRRFGSPVMQEAAVQAYDHSRQVLDGLLFGPVRRALDGMDKAGDRPLIIVPTGSLHALPWTALPTCAGRPVSVTPSARLWLKVAADDRESISSTGRGAVLVTASARQALLPHTAAEVKALAVRYPDATVLSGSEATAANVLRALDGAAMAHIATAGRFRADHPLFSSLDLADGPLYVYDLERLGSAPQTLVVSACELALSSVRPHGDLMGLASTVFALGTRTLIASVTQVDDSDTRTFMLVFHAALAAGRPPAAALAEASAATGVAGFVCLGFGG